MTRITVKEASDMLNVSQQFMRMLIIQKKPPWAVAVKHKSRHSYWINKEQMIKDMGL